MPNTPVLATDLAAVRTASRTCLNGWWDFQTADVTSDAPAAVPAEGWEPGAVLVPSFFTKPCDVTRRKGDKLFITASGSNGRKPQPLPADTEFLFDAYGFPLEWTFSTCGWHRRVLKIAEVPAGERLHLNLEAVQPVGIVFLNGVRLDSHPHPSLPHRFDITDIAHPGDNELAIFCADYPRGADDRALVPTGNGWIVGAQGGVWQDTWLERRGVVHVSAVDIRTQDGRVSAVWELTNAGSADLSVSVQADLAPWRRGEEPLAAVRARELPAQTVFVPAGQTITVSAEVADTGLARWSTHRPNLYWLRTQIAAEGAVLERHIERFGVRDLRIVGKDLVLDGVPIHLFSDWGHKSTPYHHTEAWIRQWFGMIRDANMNHTRLHTHPHPRIILDLADEEGIMVTVETGIHGSGRAQGTDDFRYWENARDHVRRLVKRDRNHPSVVMWSVENEMRWNRNTTQLTFEELPNLRRLFLELDPTRMAYHEGDTSLWDERELEVISRHYGKECSGDGWWNGKQPLHSGEMSLHHLMGPNNTLQLGGDAVFAEYAEIERAASEDSRRIIEAGRSLGVIAWGPWNLSCLINLRTETQMIRPQYTDWTAPGIKPLQVPPHSSEFAFWRPEERGYTPTPSFPGLKDAFRPLAAIDRSWRAQYRQGQSVKRVITVVNDTARALAGELTVSVGGAVLATHRAEVPRGHAVPVTAEFGIPSDLSTGRHSYTVTFTADSGEVETWSRTWLIAAPFADKRPLAGISVCAVGVNAPVAELTALGAVVTAVKTLAETAGQRIVIVGRNVIKGTDEECALLSALTASGARVLILEQNNSVFPALALAQQPFATAWIRAEGHPLTAGITDGELSFWGEDGYCLLEGSHIVSRSPYLKGEGRHALTIADTGEGAFGSGNLGAQALLEVVDDAGLIIASQFLVTGRFEDLPVAEALLTNAVRRLDAWAVPAPLALANPAAVPQIITAASSPADALAAARAGATVLVEGFGTAIGAARLAEWSAALALDIAWVPEPEKHWQAVRPQGNAKASKHEPLLTGISLEDLCGVEQWTYRGNAPADQSIADGAFAHTAGLEPLLVTATASALREFMLNTGKSEPLRAHTASRFVYGAERDTERVLLGRVRIGSGAILLSCLELPPAHPRLQRVIHRLRANLGFAVEGSILEGERTASGAPSQGFAYVVHRSKASPDEATWAAVVIASGEDPQERCWMQPWLAKCECDRLPGQWPAASEDGFFSVTPGWQPGQPIIIGTCAVSPRARKDLSSDIGVPNPEDQVFCELTGEGRAEGVLNGKPLGTLTFIDGKATFTDMELEAGRNHLVIRWWPETAEDRIRLDFRDIMRRPEVSLAFG